MHRSLVTRLPALILPLPIPCVIRRATHLKDRRPEIKRTRGACAGSHDPQLISYTHTRKATFCDFGAEPGHAIVIARARAVTFPVGRSSRATRAPHRGCPPVRRTPPPPR